jgi:hypothetical protein
MNLNDELRKLYVPYFEELKLNSKSVADKFSFPLLMKVFPDYEKVNTRILFIGKETHGWYGTMADSIDVTVDSLMNEYEGFEFAKEYQSRNSPFWRFIKIFHSTINGDTFPNGFLWTNFSKCDSGGTTPTQELQDLNRKGFDLLINEIEILKPDTIIFITGWDYEKQFQRVFSGISYEILEENFIYRCDHELLPKSTYMTMHPNGLNFRKKFKSTIDLLTALIKD